MLHTDEFVSQEYYDQTAILRDKRVKQWHVSRVAAHMAVGISLEYALLYEFAGLTKFQSGKALGYLHDFHLISKKRLPDSNKYLLEAAPALDWAASKEAIAWTQKHNLPGF